MTPRFHNFPDFHLPKAIESRWGIEPAFLLWKRLADLREESAEKLATA